MKETMTLIQREIDILDDLNNDGELNVVVLDADIEQMFNDGWHVVFEAVLFENGDTMVRVMRFEREIEELGL